MMIGVELESIKEFELLQHGYWRSSYY